MSNILKEALADGKALKAAALKNAQNLILESMKTNLKEMVEDQMNEAAEEVDSGEDEMEDTEEVVEEGLEDLELSDEDGGDEMGEDEGSLEDALEDESEDAGLSESDLQEALRSALSEVTHGSLGDQEEITPDGHPTGLMDQDKSEKGWEEKTAPAKKSFAVKEAAYQKKIAGLVTENTLLRKANSQLKRTVNEVNLFNTKLHYAHKLMAKEGLTNEAKRAIVSKLDGVKSVNEAKTLYESLQIAFGTVSEKAKKSKTSLSEALGVNGANSGKNISESAAPKREVLPEGVEANPFSPERMKFLAGIKSK